MLLALYRGLTTVGGPLISLYLSHRLARGKEDKARLRERFGRPGQPRPAGPLIWLHGASLGESLSMLPLIERLLATSPELQVLVTTGTVTSARLMAERLPERALHQFAPADLPDAVRRFLDYWRPDLALWLESEFWPNLVTGAQRRGVPMALIQGRMSARSYARWRRARGLIGTMLRGFAPCLARTPEDGKRLQALGAPRVKCVGDLKDAAPPLPADEDALTALRRAAQGRPRWLAASTHAGEEVLAGRVHMALKARFPGLLTMIVPRHPARGDEVAAALAANGLKLARRSAFQAIGLETDLYLADTLGELGLFYRLGDIVFVGGSLVPHGGQNPLEPARLGCAVLFGPHMQNFTRAVSELAAAGGAEEVADEVSLRGAVAALLGDPQLAARRGQAAAKVARSAAGVVEAIMAELGPILDVAKGA